MYRQLEIWWVDLNPTKGAETRKKRPCVILQSDWLNEASKTIVVAPLLAHHRDWPFVVNIAPTVDNGLDQKRHINIKQLRSVDISRITDKQGRVAAKYKAAIDEVIHLLFANP